MQQSSTTKLKEAPEVDTASLARSENGSQGDTTRSFRVPDFRTQNAAFATAARAAGRMNAANVSESEYDALLEERQKLLDKKFQGTMTKMEENRLTYIRWSLDRIEDARHGAQLDRLESFVAQYEDFLKDMQDFQAQLDGLKPKRK